MHDENCLDGGISGAHTHISPHVRTKRNRATGIIRQDERESHPGGCEPAERASVLLCGKSGHKRIRPPKPRLRRANNLNDWKATCPKFVSVGWSRT